MAAEINPLAGKTAEPSMLVNVPRLVTAYFAEKPDPSVPSQRVAFGTSGHRGSSLNSAFNEAHILAISAGDLRSPQAQQASTGPLFVGIDTHALSRAGAGERAGSVRGQRRRDDDRRALTAITPTPVISHAILELQQGPRATALPMAW